MTQWRNIKTYYEFRYRGWELCIDLTFWSGCYFRRGTEDGWYACFGPFMLLHPMYGDKYGN